MGPDRQRHIAGDQSHRRAPRAAFLASARSRWSCSFLVGSLFLRNPGEGLLTLTLLPDRVLHGRGHFEGDFCTDDTAVSELGLGPGSGIVGILLAFYLWASIPVSAVWVLGVLLGIELICEGAALGHLAWQARKS
jgi:uncharacterized membrane protein HdeD (DUF308 family)